MANRIEDLTGRRFGRLVVREFYDIDHYHRSRWLCECDCGGTKIVPRASLMNGDTTSCGCKNHEFDDLTGQKFGKLTVIDYDHTDTNGRTYWWCECDCPDRNRILVSRKHLIGGGVSSCGCLRHDDLVGERFGYLTVLNLDHVGNGKAHWRCRCERCGGETVVPTASLKNGTTTSCGCYKRENLGERTRTHGLTNHPLYRVWANMKSRCGYEDNIGWDRYGGRGITVCDEWLHDFKAFHDWAIENGWKPGLTIDRRNNDDGYSPWNCRIADVYTQANNRSNNRIVHYDGEAHTVKQWSDILNVKYATLLSRINRGDLSDFEEYFGFVDPSGGEL